MQQDLRSKSPLEAEERREERRRNLSHLKVGAAICFSDVLHWGRLKEPIHLGLSQKVVLHHH